MNNDQFRSFVQNDKKGQSSSSTSSGTFKTPMLGSRARSSIPITPRSLVGHDASKEFARQVAEHKRSVDGEPPTKKFKSVAVPRGVKLAQGYQDRTQLRQDDGGDDKEKRLKALEEMFKLQQIDQATFEKLRGEIGVGGDLSSTHLVKGLDWKLLEKIRKGDKLENANDQKGESATEKVNVDDQLDQMLDKDVTKPGKKQTNDVQEESKTDSGEIQPTTRDEILRRLKESRNSKPASDVLPEVELGDKFKKVANSSKPEKKKFVETVNGRRREVLIITDRNGNTKRKTRWLDAEKVSIISKPAQQPLGMEVPAEFVAKQKALLDQEAADEEDDDIFQGVGTDYNPLRDIDSESEESGAEQRNSNPGEPTNQVSKPRNYFSSTENEQETATARPIAQDPTIMAALKRAAAIRQSEDSAKDDVESNPDRELKQRQFLEKLKQRDREDDRDMDLGFGESRFGDDDDEDGPIWDGDDGTEEKKSGRKRGPKKRKGDKDNVGDVMRVLEGRKKG